MSNTLPDLQTAFNTVAQNVDDAAFFGKLAEFQIVPQSAEEANSLRELGWKLQSAEQQFASTKTASVNPFAVASSALDRALGNEKVASVNQAKQAAWNLLQDQDNYLSSLTLLRAKQAARQN